MITGTSSKSICYIPEEERALQSADPKAIVTKFWIRLKKGHDANQVLADYAGAGKDGRKGYRELNVRRLDSADVTHFLSICERVENYQFSEDYPDLHEQGAIPDVTGEAQLSQVAADLSADLLNELFEASNNAVLLKAGEKKDQS